MEDEEPEDLCTIQPLLGGERELPCLKEKASSSKVPDWLSRNEGHHHKLVSSRRHRRSVAGTNTDDSGTRYRN